MISLSLNRLLASHKKPYSSRVNRPELIELDFNGTKLNFTCPPASPWKQRNQPKNEYSSSIDLTNHSLFLPPCSTLFYTQNKFPYRKVFYREWTFWGEFWKSEFIAVISLTINIIHIPKHEPQDSLFDFDFYKSVLPDFNNDNFPELSITRMGGGLIPDTSLENRPRVGKDSIDHKGDSEREHFHRVFTLLDSQHILVFDFYHSQYPKSSSFELKNSLNEFNEKIDSTIRINYSPSVNEERKRMTRIYAERNGHEYDEEYGAIISLLID